MGTLENGPFVFFCPCFFPASYTVTISTSSCTKRPCHLAFAGIRWSQVLDLSDTVDGVAVVVCERGLSPLDPSNCFKNTRMEDEEKEEECTLDWSN